MPSPICSSAFTSSARDNGAFGSAAGLIGGRELFEAVANVHEKDSGDEECTGRNGPWCRRAKEHEREGGGDLDADRPEREREWERAPFYAKREPRDEMQEENHTENNGEPAPRETFDPSPRDRPVRLEHLGE